MVISYPFQTQVVHQNVALVMVIIPLMYKNVIQEVVCKDHHPHLDHRCKSQS